MGGGEVLKKGWLIKSPPLEGSGLKNWRKRFFALRSSKILEYYKSEDGDLKGVINLEDCKAVNSDLFHKKYKYVFDVETYDRVYYLVANSAEEMEAWVEALCNCCGFTLRPDFAPTEQASTKSMGNPKNSKSDAIISPPVSTLPANVSGMLLSEKFKSEETPSDVYSLATAAVYEVNNQLSKGGGVDIPSGTSLSDALSAKGMAASPYNPAITPLSDGAYFSPRGNDVSSLYAVPQKKLPKQQSLDHQTNPAPMHKALQGTKSDACVPFHNNPPPPPSHRSSEPFSNGGTRVPKESSSRPRPPNYDLVKGPPRPSDSPPTIHRSALLRGSSDSSHNKEQGGHTYINMKELHNELGSGPPKVNRTTKPDYSPPRIDRNLKPGSRKSLLEEDSPPDSPPNFPTRTGSISTPPVMDASDLPKPTRRTVKYSQLEFDSNNQLCLVDDEPVQPQMPVPKPRRINYCDIDIKATKDLASKQNELPKQVSLGEAEAAALTEKPYVNIGRDGFVDDDTDPDYYTHMRDLSGGSLFRAVMEDEGGLYDLPPKESQ